MSIRTERPDLLPELDAVLAEVTALEGRYPEGLRLKDELFSEYFALPYLFIEAFPSLSIERVRPVAVFCRLFASSIFLHDKLADGEAVGALAARSSLRVVVMQSESHRILAELFPPGRHPRFWARFRGYLAEYVEASLTELDFVTGRRPLADYSDALGLRVAAGKSGLSRAVPAALAELAGEGEDEYEYKYKILGLLEEALDGYNRAAQMLDDLRDWKDDLQRGAPSILLARATAALAARGAPAEKLAGEIYYGGHARALLELALTALDAAGALKEALPRLGFHGMVASLRREHEELLRDIDRIVEENRRRARER